MKRIFKYKLHWSIWSIVLVSIALFSAYQVNVKAMGQTVFAGRVSAIIPMSVCTNQYSCGACSLCGCGAWDQVIIAPIFGVTSNSMYYVCSPPSYIPKRPSKPFPFVTQSEKGFKPGEVVMGSCSSTHLTVYNPITCNIWADFQ